MPKYIKLVHSYYDDGNLHTKRYYLNNKLHNTNGPALITFYHNGNILSEQYIINGKNHNENGPAGIWYNINGTVSYQSYYYHGVFINSRSLKEYKEYIRTIILT